MVTKTRCKCDFSDVAGCCITLHRRGLSNDEIRMTMTNEARRTPMLETAAIAHRFVLRSFEHSNLIRHSSFEFLVHQGPLPIPVKLRKKGAPRATPNEKSRDS